MIIINGAIIVSSLIFSLSSWERNAYIRGCYFFLTITATLIILLNRDYHAFPDYVSYLNLYTRSETISGALNAFHGDIFFSILMYIYNFFGVDAKFFFITQPILYAVITIIAFQQIDGKHWIAMYSLFILSSTFLLLYNNVIRQGLALTFLFLALASTLNKKNLSFYLFSILAILSHSSAIFVFFAMVMSRKKISHRITVLYLLLIPVLPLIFSKLMPIFSVAGITKVDAFYNYGYDNNLVYLKCIILYFCAIFFTLFFKGTYRLNERLSYIVRLYVYLTAVSIMLLPVLLLSSRFLYYPSAMLPIIFTYCFVLKSRIKRKFPFSVWIIMFMVSVMFFGFQVYSFPSIKRVLGF